MIYFLVYATVGCFIAQACEWTDGGKGIERPGRFILVDGLLLLCLLDICGVINLQGWSVKRRNCVGEPFP